MLVDGTDGKLVLSNNTIQDLSNVYVPITPSSGDALVWNATNSRWEAGNPAASGGAFVGDIQGSVFADDSTLLVDGINQTINVPEIVSPSNDLLLQADGIRTSYSLQRNDPTLDSSLALYDLGIIRFRMNDINGAETKSFIRGRNADIIMAAGHEGEDFPDTSLFVHAANSTSVGMFGGPARFNVRGEIFCSSTLITQDVLAVAYRLDDSSEWFNAATQELRVGQGSFHGSVDVVGSVNANSVFATEIQGNIIGDDSTVIIDHTTGAINASIVTGDLKGSVFADDSTAIIDGINKTVIAGGFVQFGSYNTTERNALTAVNGMVIYNSQVNRFQGYQNSAWINIDDGTAA